MPIPVDGAAVRVEELEKVLGRTLKSVDRPAAQFALDMCTEVVFTEMGGDPEGWPEAEAFDVATVRAVILRSAVAWFTNPQDRASYSGPEGLAFAPTPARMSRIISPDDREKLMLVKVKYQAGFG